MTLEEYIPKAVATEAPASTFLEVVNSHKNVIRGLHAAIGFTTEAGEILQVWDLAKSMGITIDRVNLIEEIGDGFWYSALARFAEPILWECPFPVLSVVETQQMQTMGTRGKGFRIAKDLVVHSAKFLDLYKKWVFYPKQPTDEHLKAAFFNVEYSLVRLSLIAGKHPYEVREINIAKLTDKNKGRYKGGEFTSTEAENRNLEAEREVLEEGHGSDNPE